MATQMDAYGQPIEDPNNPAKPKPAATAQPQANSQVPLAPPANSSTPLATGSPTTQSVAQSNIPLAAPSQPYATTTSSAPGSNANYLGTTIQPGPATDRYAIAQSRYDDFAKSTDPYYQKALRDVKSAAFGRGQGGSGMLRTSLGDAANLRNIQLDTARSGFLNDALEGSIGDAYKNIGIAQQQQGFQAGQQREASSQDIANRNITLAERQADAGNKLAEGSLTGNYGGNLTLAAKQAADATALNREQLGLSAELGRGNLELAKTGQGQSYELSKAAQELQRQVQTGQLTLAQANQKLAELQNSQQYGLATRAADSADQQTAFNQASEEARLNEMLTSGSFGRSLSQLSAGMLGNPTDIALSLAGLYGGQASSAGQGAGSLLSNAAIANAVRGGGGTPTSGGNDWLGALISALGGGGAVNLGGVPQNIPIASPDFNPNYNVDNGAPPGTEPGWEVPFAPWLNGSDINPWQVLY